MKKLQPIIIALALLLPLFSFSQDYWEQVPSPDNILILCISVNQQGDIFLGAGGDNGNPGGVYRSTDSGETWELVFDTGDFAVYQMAISQDEKIYISKGRYPYFQVSDDNGDTWDKIVLPVGDRPTKILPVGSDTIYVGMSDNYVATLLRSPDNGATWDSLFTSSLDGSISDIVISPGGIIYMSFTSHFSNEGGVYRSEDNGITWEFLGLFNHMVSALALNSTGDLFAGSWGGLDYGYAGFYVLRNGEDEWDTLIKGPQVSDVVVNSENDIFFSSYWPDGVVRSLDNGETFELINEGLLGGPMGYLTIDDLGFLYVTTSYLTNYFAKSINTTVSVQENVLDNNVNSIVIYPNPVKEYVTLNSIRPDKPIFLKKLSVYNGSFTLISCQRMNIPIQGYQANLNFLVPGIYFMEIETEDSNYIFKIVKY